MRVAAKGSEIEKTLKNVAGVKLNGEFALNDVFPGRAQYSVTQRMIRAGVIAKTGLGIYKRTVKGSPLRAYRRFFEPSKDATALATAKRDLKASQSNNRHWHEATRRAEKDTEAAIDNKFPRKRQFVRVGSHVAVVQVAHPIQITPLPDQDGKSLFVFAGRMILGIEVALKPKD